jgi:hypothetical protein
MPLSSARMAFCRQQVGFATFIDDDTAALCASYCRLKISVMKPILRGLLRGVGSASARVSGPTGYAVQSAPVHAQGIAYADQ